MADLFQQMRQQYQSAAPSSRGPTATDETLSEPGRVGRPKAPGAATAKALGLSPKERAMEERMRQYRSSPQGALVSELQGDASGDLALATFQDLPVNLMKAAVSSAEGALRITDFLTKGADMLGRNIAHKLRGEKSDWTTREQSLLVPGVKIGAVANDITKAGMTPQQAAVFDNERLAEQLDRNGKTEEARQVRANGETMSIEALTDREIADMVNPPSTTKKVARWIAKEGPLIYATMGRSGPVKATTKVGKVLTFAGREANEGALYGLLKRDPSKTGKEQAIGVGTEAATAFGASLGLQAFAKALPPVYHAGKAVVSKILMKKAAGEAVSELEENAVVNFVKAKHILGKGGDDIVDEGFELPKIMKDEVVEIPIDRIKFDPEHIEKAAKAIDMGEARVSGGDGTLPIKIIEQGDSLVLYDGNRRLFEAMQRGEKTIAARFMREPTAGKMVKKSTSQLLPETSARLSEVMTPGQKALDDALRITAPPRNAKQPLQRRIVGGTQDALRKTHEYFVSRFQPLTDVQRLLYRKAGQEMPAVKLSEDFELVAGAQAKAEIDVLEQQRDIWDPLRTTGKWDDFYGYLFLKRTVDRLSKDAKTRRVGTWTVEKAQEGLKELKTKIGAEDFAMLETLGKRFQQYSARNLDLMLNSGKISQELYDTIRGMNDFYVPFKVMDTVAEADEAMTKGMGMGKSVSNVQDLTKKITGIADDEFFVDDISEALAQQTYRARVLSEKNVAMKQLYSLVGMEGSDEYIRVLKGDAKPPKGWGRVHVSNEGADIALAVDPRLAKSIQGLDMQMRGVVANALRLASTPFRQGATTFNIPFQVYNVGVRDPLRLVSYFKYGRSPTDIAMLPMDFIRGFYHALKGNLGNAAQASGDDMFRDFMRYGSAGGSVQEFLTPGEFRKVVRPPENLLVKYGRKLNVLRGAAKVGRALEHTGKITGWMRGMREVNRKFGVTGLDVAEDILAKNPKYADAIKELVVEVRNFAGSPDFARMGHLSPDTNLVLGFFNARLQGIAADVGRLTGNRGRGTAGAWAATSALATIAIANRIRNRLYFNEDTDKLLSWEDKNYSVVFTNSTFINEDGQEVREGYHLPKEGVQGAIIAAMEKAVDFAFDRDPVNATQIGMSLIEGLSPLNIDGANFAERTESAASNLLPPFRLPFEIMMNRDLFRHRDIVPQSLAERSPELQFRDSTPEAFKAVGGATGTSPLKLEQAATSLTGGFTRQFQQAEPLPGRSFFSDFVLTRRFYKSPWVNEADAQGIINKFARESADKEALRRMEAEKKFASIKGMSRQNAEKELRRIAKDDRLLADEIVDVAKEQEKGFTYTERRLRALGVKDGSRAKAIHEIVTTQIKRGNRNTYVKELQRKGIISEEVARQLSSLFGQ